MKIRVLGSAGAEFPGFHPPAFLVDDVLLLDAGTTGAVLTADEQAAIRAVCVTHAHLDHIRGIPVLADNLAIGNRHHALLVAGIKETVATLRNNVFNGVVWPDFSNIPSAEAPIILYQTLLPEVPVTLAGYNIIPCPVNHTVPAVGYLVRRGETAILYSGDTGPTDRLWQLATGLAAMIVEVSFPNDREELALKTGHLTSRLLGKELGKIAALPPLILVTHPKPQYFEQIRRELVELAVPQLELLHDGAVYEL
jgi:ribonuclease BN (tRNA processing enzyme)